ncbi:hypothetical protein EGW08_008352 [Elysia chlorotica]|uniref:Beta-1,4-galactosyltransferase n=1 Tax=Elysia chlorotica TaxID=188477 RepID=A0A3S0ZPJ4_ELYCH|nr:hypothetical protein EGW08_008352 [Elysia chlorotica]
MTENVTASEFGVDDKNGDLQKDCLTDALWVQDRDYLSATPATVSAASPNDSRLSWHSGYMVHRMFTLELAGHKRVLPLCEILDKNQTTLKGPIDADTDWIPNLGWLEEWLEPLLLPGGLYIPQDCRPSHKVAVIVPFRERCQVDFYKDAVMHPFLQRQRLQYGVYVIEQVGDSLFNRALLMNVGYTEALRLHPSFDCFVFHDVDLLPLDDRISYSCGDQPIHLTRLMYANLFGGASMLTRDMVEKVNGFSNVFFGWGGEDDDMSFRVRSHNMTINRYTLDIARYTMIRHVKENKIDRQKLLKEGRKRIHRDGLNTLKYELIELDLKPLFTLIKVKVNQSQILAEQGL